MATTVPDGIWTPDDSTAYNPPVDLAAMADTIQGALNGIRTDGNQQFYGPAAAIGTVTGMKRGDTYQESDGSFIFWRYNGANWLTDEKGSYLIRPTSVVGGSMNADGSVAFTNSAAVSLNGVFSSRFNSYELQWSISSRTSSGASGIEGIRLRSGGVDNSAGVYAWRRVVSVGTGHSETFNASETSWGGMAGEGFQVSSKKLRIVGPHLPAVTTAWDGKGVEFNAGSGALVNIIDYVGAHKAATAFDSFTLHIPSGTMSGTVRVVGLV